VLSFFFTNIRRRRVYVRRRIVRRVVRRIAPQTQRQSSGRKQYLLYKEQARVIITERVGHFSEKYAALLSSSGIGNGLKVGRIAIRNQRSRWGSCSRNGNLNFNYKIAFLAPELRDYVIVHEICHIKEFNHGRGFWNLVGETTPNYLELRRILRAMECAGYSLVFTAPAISVPAVVPATQPVVQQS